MKTVAQAVGEVGTHVPESGLLQVARRRGRRGDDPEIFVGHVPFTLHLGVQGQEDVESLEAWCAIRPSALCAGGWGDLEEHGLELAERTVRALNRAKLRRRSPSAVTPLVGWQCS